MIRVMLDSAIGDFDNHSRSAAIKTSSSTLDSKSHCPKNVVTVYLHDFAADKSIRSTRFRGNRERERELDWQSARGYEWCIVKCAGDTKFVSGGCYRSSSRTVDPLDLEGRKICAAARTRPSVGRLCEVVPSPPSWDHLPTAKGGTNRRSLDAAYAAPNLFFMSTCGELRKGRAIVPQGCVIQSHLS